jgi:hypothetical protein
MLQRRSAEELEMPATRHARTSAPRSVRLHLSRGVSTHVTWLLRSAPSATTVTIGSSPSCDWQITARGVAPHALSVALFDGGLFVASGPGAVALLDGEALPEVWKRVEDASRIDFGVAQVELHWERDDAPREFVSERDRPTYPEGLAEAEGMDAGASARTARSSWVDHFSRSSLLEIPSVLGRVADSRKSSLLSRYLWLVLFTALAYRAWLLLLDRI